MQVSPSPTPWSTVAALPDYLLLSQTRQLARHEQALQILVLDHLREIEARRLHLTRGYGSLFDYVVHELDYTAAAAWRRIKAMRLCTETDSARELLQDGSLNLSNAAQLQNLFERSDRSRSRPPARHGAGGALGGAPRNDGAPGESAPPAAVRAGERDPGPAAGPVLDAAAREELVKQAAGKSTREVQQMLAEVDPELAQPSDRMRALGGGRWELKAAVDAECRHGLEKLQMLLSHQGPHLTLGGLVARLVRDGLHRYDPERPRRSRRPGGGASVDGARTPSKPARRDTETVQRNVVRAKGSDVERRSKIERDDTSLAADGDGTPRPSAPTRQAEGERGSAKPAAVRDIVRRAASAPKRVTQDEHAHTEEAQRVRGAAASAPGRHREAEHACGQPQAMHGRGGRAASPAKRHGRADGEGRDAGVDGVPDRATCAAGVRFEADRRDASRVPARGGHRCSNSPAKRLAYAAGRGAVERSPALQRHLAALSCFGALPGSRSRYIPVAVKREVWRRDQGRCSYVDRHSGRRCGSRYRLEIDHIVPFALGGPTDLVNLRVRCRAHHRLRHAHAESVPPEARRAPVLAVDPKERAWTVGPHAAIDRAGA